MRFQGTITRLKVEPTANTHSQMKRFRLELFGFISPAQAQKVYDIFQRKDMIKAVEWSEEGAATVVLESVETRRLGDLEDF